MTDQKSLTLEQAGKVSVSSEQEMINSLKLENNKLKRINEVLVQRVDMGVGNQSAAYQSFESAVHLTNKVKQRTQKLQTALERLEQSNVALSLARKESESSQQRMIDAVESFSDAFVLFGSENTIVLANRRFYLMWQSLSENPEVGKTTLSDIHKITDKFSADIMTETDTDTQQIFRTPDREWIRMSERPTADGGLVIVFSDITGIKENETRIREKALEAKSQVLQSTLDNISQGVALVNSDGKLEAWNDSFRTISGKSNDDLSTNSNFDFLLADSEVNCSVAQSHQGDIYREEKTTSDGRVIEIQHHSIVGGGYVNTYTDTTERSKHEAALSQSEQRIRLITDAMPALISYIRDDLCYDFVNQAFSEWFCKPREKILDQSMATVIGRREYEEHRPYIERAMSGEVVSFRTKQVVPNKGEIVLHKTYVPHFTARRKVQGVFTLEQDVTKQIRTSQALSNAYQTLETRVQERTKELIDLNSQLETEITERSLIEVDLIRAKRAAEEANISKTKFMASVSHDLLQPMNAAKLFLSALNETNQVGKVGELIDSLNFSLFNMESLLISLVNISKLDAGVIDASYSSFCVNDLLDNLANESTPKAEAANVGFRYIACSAVVRSDSQLLARILRNLLSNAFRYLGEGEVLLGCRRRDDGLEIQVIDTGLGIPENMFEEIFKEFKRGKTPNRQDRGLGLGLAIVQKIGKVLDHKITVQSELGKGSNFSVLVPYGSKGHVKAKEVKQVTPTTVDLFHGQRVLVVDNDESICNAMQNLLSMWGCKVSIAFSINELQAKPELINERLDLLIVDYHLDDEKTGIEVLQYVREIVPVPVIMVTAIHDQELRQKMASAGHYLLHKPLKPLKLKSLMMHLLSKK